VNAHPDPWWLQYLGGIVDDGNSLRAVLPFVGTARDRAQELTDIAAWYDRRGVSPPAQVHEEISLPRGGQSSERRFFIALYAIIEQRLRPDKTKVTDGITTDDWSEPGSVVSDEAVKAARLEHTERAEQLIDIWLRWSRDKCGITARRTDAEILAAYQRAILAETQCYPPDATPRGRKAKAR
jgi:hypothetical protein